MRANEFITEKWTKKYKKSINCSNPKGFSQKAHCAGRKARRAGKKTKSSSVSEEQAINELRANPEKNIKLPISQQIMQIVSQNGGTIDDYWIHSSPVDHIGFFGGSKFDAVDVSTEPMQGQFKLSNPEFGRDKYLRNSPTAQSKGTKAKPGVWLSPLKKVIKKIDLGRVPYAGAFNDSGFVFLVKLKDGSWLQPVNKMQMLRTNLVGINPPKGKRKVGIYNPTSGIAVVFEPVWNIVGKWTAQEVKNQATRNLKKVAVEEETAIKLRGFGPSEKTKEFVAKVNDMFYNEGNNSYIFWNHEGNQIPKGKEETKDIAAYVQFELVPKDNNKVEVKWIQATPLRGGYGSKGMQILKDLAQQDDIALTLYPWDKGQVSQSKLIKFYKKQGFNPLNKSKNMIWEPK